MTEVRRRKAHIRREHGACGVAIMAMLWALVSCSDAARAITPADVMVTVRAGAITARQVS